MNNKKLTIFKTQGNLSSLIDIEFVKAISLRNT